MGNNSTRQKLEKKKLNSNTKIKKDEKSLAENYQENGDYKKAIKIYKNLIEKNLVKSEIFYNTSICYLNLGFYENSILYIKMAKNGEPNNDSFFRLSGFLNMKIFKKKQINKYFLESYDDFCTAYEIDKKNEKNPENFFGIKKFRFFKKEEDLEIKKKNLLVYLKKFEEEKNFTQYFKKYFFEKKNNNEIPNFLNCPINLEILRNPFQTPFGNSYEKNTLDLCFKTNGSSDPLTGMVIFPITKSFKNKILALYVKSYLRKNPWVWNTHEDIYNYQNSIVFEY